MRFRNFPELEPFLLGLLSVDDDTSDDSDGGGSGDEIDPDAETDPDRKALKLALKKERDARKAESRELRNLKAELESLKGKLDPDSKRSAEEVARAIAEATAAINKEWEERVNKLKGKTAEEKAALARERDQEREARQAERLRTQAERAFYQSDGKNATSADGTTQFEYFYTLNRDKFGLDDQGLYVRDADGEPRMDEEDPRKRLAPDKYLLTLHSDPLHGQHFNPQRGAGSGGRSGRDTRPGGSPRPQDLPKGEEFRHAFGGVSRR